MRMTIKQGPMSRLVWSQSINSAAPFCSLCQTFLPKKKIAIWTTNECGMFIQFCVRCAEESIEVTADG